MICSSRSRSSAEGSGWRVKISLCWESAAPRTLRSLDQSPIFIAVGCSSHGPTFAAVQREPGLAFRWC